jgi:hypothetical protein
MGMPAKIGGSDALALENVIEIANAIPRRTRQRHAFSFHDGAFLPC